MPEKQSDFLKFAIKTAKEASKILARMRKRAKIVKYKGKGDFALDADYASEKHIMQRIRKKYPDHAILTEETGKHDKKSDYLWIIDPIDGTLNYAHDLPFYTISIALYKKDKPVVGVVYVPAFQELFYATKGKGAYLNGKKIRVGKAKTIDDAYISLNFAHYCKINWYKHGLRYLGCESLELCYVACGRYDAHVRLKGKDPFGYGAGSLIVLEAGGKITDCKGKKWNIHSNGILATNGKVHNKILKVTKTC